MPDDRLMAHARRMRRAPALYERHLWRLLRDRRLNGLKFRRQVVIDRFIVDFVCLRHRLIVEADGPFHVEEADADRDRRLADLGFRTLRFPNQQIETRGWQVIAAILEATRANADPKPPL